MNERSRATSRAESDAAPLQAGVIIRCDSALLQTHVRAVECCKPALLLLACMDCCSDSSASNATNLHTFCPHLASKAALNPFLEEPRP